MKRAFCILLATLAGLGGLRLASADVAIQEPSSFSVEGSDIIAVAEVQSVKGKAPFTNVNPPMLLLRVERDIKGCREGEILEVSGWQARNDVVRGRSGLPLPNAEAEWRATSIAVPPVGTRILVFLKRDGAVLHPYFNGWHVRIAFENPWERLVTQVDGMATWRVDSLQRTRESRIGEPVLFEGELTNISGRERSFDPAQLVLFGVNDGRDRNGVLARPGALAPMKLGPKETRRFAWDLGQFFPGAFDYPGQYNGRLDGPAQLGLDVLVTGTPSYESTVASCPFVFSARVQALENVHTLGPGITMTEGSLGDLVLVDREFLRVERELENDMVLRRRSVPWPLELGPLPKVNDILIVCAVRTGIRHAVPRTPEWLARTRAGLERHRSAQVMAYPSSMCVEPSGKFAYVTNGGQDTISAYRIDAATGALTALGTTAAGMYHPDSVAVDPAGRFLYVTSEDSRTLAAFRVDAATGALTKMSTVEAMIPFRVTLDPRSRYIYVSNGHVVSTYRIDEAARALTALGIVVTEGRFMTVDPSGQFAYMAAGSKEISTYRIDAGTGAVSKVGAVEVKTAPLSITVDPRGRYAYAANHLTISARRINAATGTLSAPGRPITAEPNFHSITFDPRGRSAYVIRARSDSMVDTVTAYQINTATGALTPMGAPLAAGRNARSMAIDPSGRFAYIVNMDSHTISAYRIDAVTGALTGMGATEVSARSASVSVGVK